MLLKLKIKGILLMKLNLLQKTQNDNTKPTSYGWLKAAITKKQQL